VTRPSDDTLLAFLEGTLEAAERDALLERLDRDPELARELRQAAAGLFGLQSLGNASVDLASETPHRPGVRSGPLSGAPRRSERRAALWWAAAASAATLLIAVPVTTHYAGREALPTLSNAALGRPASPEPSFVLVLHGLWPDAAAITQDERVRRAAEYWAWTSSLATEGVLLAAGDLRWEPGQRLEASGVESGPADVGVDSPDFLVGMFALRVGSYEAALSIARACPHLKYGGSVSVRQVGSGFVTAPGLGDWKG
jgi:hypothetical protein